MPNPDAPSFDWKNADAAAAEAVLKQDPEFDRRIFNEAMNLYNIARFNSPNAGQMDQSYQSFGVRMTNLSRAEKLLVLCEMHAHFSAELDNEMERKAKDAAHAERLEAEARRYRAAEHDRQNFHRLRCPGTIAILDDLQRIVTRNKNELRGVATDAELAAILGRLAGDLKHIAHVAVPTERASLALAEADEAA